MEAITLDISALGQLNDDQLFDFCRQNDNLRIERNAKGQLIIMTPTGGKTGNLNFIINGELFQWKKKFMHPGYLFDSSTGFRLPDGSMLSPDASWVKENRWDALSDKKKEKFPPLCPDFVIELRSPSDRLENLQHKMDKWMENGCRLAWLIDPVEETAYVYAPGKEVGKVPSFDSSLYGGDLLKDFQLDLSILK